MIEQFFTQPKVLSRLEELTSRTLRTWFEELDFDARYRAATAFPNARGTALSRDGVDYILQHAVERSAVACPSLARWLERWNASALLRFANVDRTASSGTLIGREDAKSKTSRIRVSKLSGTSARAGEMPIEQLDRGGQGPHAVALQPVRKPSDMVVRGNVPCEIKKSIELWVRCVVGALNDYEYVAKLANTMKKRVLILCTGNSARSQMAEGLLDHDAGDRFEVESAGTKPGRVRAEAIAVMKELGIDISDHRSKHVDEFQHQSFDYVLTVCDRAKESCPVFSGHSKRIHKAFQDPAALQGTEDERLALFRRVRNEIRDYLKTFPS